MASPARQTGTRPSVETGLLASQRCAYCHEPRMLQPAGTRLARCRACSFVVPLPQSAERDVRPGIPAGITPLRPGTLLRDRYRLLRVIGEGAHGLTFLAHHEFLNLPCVVKVLPYRIAEASDDAARRLRAEASAGYRVNHPNVVRVQDGDIFQGLCYFVMEYVEGVDLAAAVTDGVLIDWRQAVRFAIDAARGLDAIHRAGLAHRDIKPANLILGIDGTLRIADLGIARLIHKYPAVTGPDQERAVGTLAYAAPEVFTPDGQVGPQADLYSLGATLFELVTSALPRGGGVYRTLLNLDRASVSWPSDAPRDVPAWFIDAILCLLEPASQKRFQSPGALVDYLEHPTELRVTEDRPPRPERLKPRGVVVLPFGNASGAEKDDWLGHALADHLARSLAQLPSTYVVDLEQFLTTLERVEQRGPRPRTQQLLEAGRLSGAATVIEGSFRRSDGTIELGLRLHQMGQPEPPEVKAVRGALSKVAKLEAELLRRVAGALQLQVAETTPASNIAARKLPAAEERFFTAKRAFLRGDYETAMGLGKEAIDLDPEYGEAVGFLGVCCARMGRYEEALEYNRQQQLLAARDGDARLKVEALANLGAMHYFRGEYPSANECLVGAAKAAEKLGLATELAAIRNNLGFVLLQLGRQAEAEKTYLRAVDTHKRYGALVALVGPYNGMGNVLREQRRYGEARSYFRRALALAQESDDYVNMGVAYMNLGRCAVLQGRLPDAKHELAVALNILEQTSFWNGLARVYEYMADLNLRLGNHSEAIRCAERRIELARRHSNRRMELAAWRQKAEALRLAGRTAEANICLASVDSGVLPIQASLSPNTTGKPPTGGARSEA